VTTQQLGPLELPLPDATSPEPLIWMRGIEKRFGSLVALRGVDFDVLAGEVHGLLGQNGAGKTTLVNVIAGILRPDAGEIRIGGEPVHLTSVAEGKTRGISVVHQALALVPTLSVAQNMYLGSEPRRARFLVDSETMNEAAERLLAHYGIPLRPTQLVGTLPFAYRQLLEIAKALALESKLLILDEPTSSLSRAEEPILFRAVREVTTKGIGVVYVTHRLSEVMELTDRVTVLRDGAKVGTFATSQISVPRLVEAIVGSSVERLDQSLNPTVYAPGDGRDVVLELHDVHSRGVNGATLTLRRGDVVGLVGTTGSGRTELLETVFGVRAVRSGSLTYHGEVFRPRSSGDSIRRGIKLVPEDRHKWGLVLDHTIERNIAMPNLSRLTRWHALFRGGESRHRADQIRNRLKVKAPSIDVRLDRLSGGNQQKVVIGKWLDGATDVLLLDEPTAGIDVGARADIYQIVLQLALEGTAILVSSSDYAELMEICSSFVFTAKGEVVGSAARAEVRDEQHLYRMLDEAMRARFGTSVPDARRADVGSLPISAGSEEG